MKRAVAVLMGLLGIAVVGGAIFLGALVRASPSLASRVVLFFAGCGMALVVFAARLWNPDAVRSMTPFLVGWLTSVGTLFFSLRLTPEKHEDFELFRASVCIAAGVVSGLINWRRSRARLVEKPRLTFGSTLAGRIVAMFMASLFPPVILVVMGHHEVARHALVLNGAVYLVLLPVVIVLHEAGHALMGRLVGMRVSRIDIGFGPRVWSGRIADCNVRVHAVPAWGLTFATPTSRNMARARTWLMIAAGPAVNLALMWLVLPEVSLDDSLRRCAAEFAPADTFFWVNAIIIGPNLLPLRLKLGGGVVTTDGAKLLTLPFVRRKGLDELLASDTAVEVIEAIETGDLRRARTLVDAGRAAYPEVFVMQYLHATLPQLEGNPRLAITDLNALRQRADLQEHQKLVVLNDLAYALTLVGEAGSSDNALAFSAEIVQKSPTVAAFLSTRGAVLARYGDPAEADTFLVEAIRLNSQERSRAESTAWRAFAAHRRGERARSRELLDEAARFHAESGVLRMLRTEIDASTPVQEAFAP